MKHKGNVCSLQRVRVSRKECLYKGTVRQAVAAIMVVGPQVVIEKMYKWTQREGIWIDREGALTAEEAEQLQKQ